MFKLFKKDIFLSILILLLIVSIIFNNLISQHIYTNFFTNTSFITSFLSHLYLPFTIFVYVIIKLIISNTAISKHKGIISNKPTLIVVSAVTTLLIVVGILFMFRDSPNKAQQNLQPFINNMKSINATKICDNGDNGKGMDNKIPWYRVLFFADDKQDLKQQIIDFAKLMNYTLSTNTARIDYLKRQVELYGSDSEFNQSNDYLTSDTSLQAGQPPNKPTLTVEIIRAGAEKSRCGSVVDYNELVKPDVGRVVIAVDYAE